MYNVSGDTMKEFKIYKLIIFTAIYGFLSLLTFLFLTWDGLSIWMGINVGFAMIPLIIIVYLHDYFIKHDKKINWLIIMGLLIFLFFYPNTFYILTDFMHIDSLNFYTVESIPNTYGHIETLYKSVIDPYFMLFHIVFSSIVGVLAGIQSLLYLEKMIELKFNNRRLNTFVVFVMMFLSATGVYLGRFLRFFSFDILRPLYLLQTFFDSIELFTFSFIVVFTGVELIFYYGYKYSLITTPDK